MTYDDDNQEPQPSFLQRHRIAVGVGVVVVIGGIIYAVSGFVKGGSSSTRRAPDMVMVKLPPPPPPPPPKPLPPPPKQEQEQLKPEQPKMVEQAPINEPVDKPDEPKPDAPPAANPLAVDAVGTGPGDAFGLVGQPGARGIGGGGTGNGIGGKGGGRGGKWGWYASQVQMQVEEAMRNNRKTRSADLRIELKLWPDLTGRIERVVLASSTGDAAVDEALKNEVLVGLKLKEAPPADMPLPINMRITARRPN